MRHFLKLFSITAALVALLPFASCDGGSDACDGFVCSTGTSCLITDGQPNCVSDGGINGGGQNGVGEECDSDDDCQATLTCQADLNGNLTCQ
jgi:hypothetical protein